MSNNIIIIEVTDHLLRYHRSLESKSYIQGQRFPRIYGSDSQSKIFYLRTPRLGRSKAKMIAVYILFLFVCLFILLYSVNNEQILIFFLAIFFQAGLGGTHLVFGDLLLLFFVIQFGGVDCKKQVFFSLCPRSSILIYGNWHV